ncbi:hypothetical protein E5K00_11390 [Hymenobacter aquaticus]|uniref:Uncharacterized protein n=1 Tax=Hymenobacter aquaticus TaxID=1867101 RepID=A0A4Z0QAM5_9BACT|nr:hypothetical protein [Hymenobacter aquaticus]TGE25762.1 hypothetical protein E5K00_11390 [Hymenobacter aquaticus]
MMTITHRAADASAAPLPESKPEKVARLACCCKLSDLLPIVRQLHEQTRNRAPQSAHRPEAA